MNATATDLPGDRPIDRWFASYSGDHQNPTNQKIHFIAVPLILWSVTALLWTIPVPGTLFGPGMWAALASYIAWFFYNRASRKLGYGMLAVLFGMLMLNMVIQRTFGMQGLLYGAIGVFVVAWVAQFIGHKIEGKKPSFFTDLVYLLIGPAWVLAKVYRKLGWSW